MFGLPEGKGIIAFSDTAGANACLSLAFMLGKEGEPSPSLYTNNPNFIDNDWGLNVSLIQSIEELPTNIQADFVFTGTSHPDSSKGFELLFIHLAKRLKIPSISFIDHWINFKLRFTDSNGRVTFPNEIWVVDEKAKQLAVEAGLPIEIIHVSGNHYHQYLKSSWQSNWLEKSYLASLNIPEKGKHVLFVPDPISLRSSKAETGFMEDEALKSILDFFKTIDKKEIHLIVKCHPLQPLEILQSVIKKHDFKKVYFLTDCDNLELISASDLIIGMYSNMLLDANALGKDVIRYFPGFRKKDLLSHTSLIKTENKKHLYAYLREFTVK